MEKFIFVVTNGRIEATVTASSESEALDIANAMKCWHQGSGLWCTGIATKSGDFNPREVFPPFMNPSMMDIFGRG